LNTLSLLLLGENGAPISVIKNRETSEELDGSVVVMDYVCHLLRQMEKVLSDLVMV